MFRLLLRLLGLCLLATAFVTVLGDVTRSVAGAKLYVTPLGETLMALAPTSWPWLGPSSNVRFIHSFGTPC